MERKLREQHCNKKVHGLNIGVIAFFAATNVKLKQTSKILFEEKKINRKSIICRNKNMNSSIKYLFKTANNQF